MRRFVCEHCDNEIRFDSMTCPVCSVPLGYAPVERTIRQLHPSGETDYRIAGHTTEHWRCLNAAFGCNWILPAASGATWCASCALTRGRPDDSRPDAIAAWAEAEAAKRRLLHELDRLGLPVWPKTDETPDGVVFDLVYLPGERGITGHLNGVVTLDLAEAEPAHRDKMRRQLGESFRTLIGSLRHEVGHHFWRRLVEGSDVIAEFRAVFGDERTDYATALQRYYSRVDNRWDEHRFVSEYAQSHPHEDWAETFAHYLHLVDLVDTAAAHDLIDVGTPADDALPVPTGATFRELLDRWRPIARAVDDLADTVGAGHLYPVHPEGAVVDKLTYVHALVTAHSLHREDVE